LRTFGLQSTASLLSQVAMPNVKNSASTILTAFGQVQSDLIGKAVVLTDGKAGTVENVWLDELHGLRISIQGHDGKWPVSTIKFTQAQIHAGLEKTSAAS
jgi:PRC-barrel domain